MANRAEGEATPMMRQYEEARRELAPGTLLLFRLGDFYELFQEDAEVAARTLGLTLTQRQGTPMAGLPAHAAEGYIARLLAAGHRVALCDQLEPPRPGRLVRRALTRILSPGTALEPGQLEAGAHRFLAAGRVDRHGLHAAWLDLSTGDFFLATEPVAADVLDLLGALDPAEVLVEEADEAGGTDTAAGPGAGPTWRRWLMGRRTVPRPAGQFDPAAGLAAVCRSLGVLRVDGFGVPPDCPALGPAGAILAYVAESLRAPPGNLRRLQLCRAEGTVLLDAATRRNLEVLRNTRGGREHTLFEAVNRTRTAAGARLLESWLAAPTRDRAATNRRQEAVGCLAGQPAALATLRDRLGATLDLVRILARLQNRLRSPRDLGGVRDTLAVLPALAAVVEQGWPGAPAVPRPPSFPDLAADLAAHLADELPAAIEDGGAIRAGADAELDRLRALGAGHRDWVSRLEREEQARTGIRSLKVRFNANFGYFIEVTKANLHLVPPDYVRRQTTVGGERYVTEALRQREREIAASEDEARARERTLFEALVARVLARADGLADAARVVAELDVLAGWAALAREWDYCRPWIDDGPGLRIEQGRHPVVEQVLRAEQRAGRGAAFVPNDTDLDAGEAQIAVLTGPNMAGKSTYIRQVALIALLAHAGCWVPARSCRLGWVDRIFSRIGASDDLARGSSTFMVEMTETANILHHATPRSLVVLDEVGRGTSTYDGMSLAWAVVEHLHGPEPQGPRTLFATHYLELTQLERVLPRVRNFTVVVKEWNDTIVFARQVVAGAADRSYGIQVARLAGLPPAVVARAGEILQRLEAGAAIATARPGRPSRPRLVVEEPPAGQLELGV